MAYSELESLSSGEFKRLCGVSRDTFAQMIEVLRPHLERQGKRGGQNKLSAEDQQKSDIGVLARVSQPVSHCHQLGIARNHGRSHDQKSGRYLG